MHIPDGYLSPSTCAGLYAASAPFWYVALRRVRQVLNTRTIPLLSVFSAFSFVVMMFNLPLPGGTTGHAVGMGAATVVLGPWFSLLAISTALAIQALLFGDGGVTTFGANSFNMAVAGSFAAYLTYQLVAGRSALNSPRRTAAAGVAGYAGINIAALCAAIEFGLQPRFFHDAAGVPLYAPYPLHIAIPAMLLGHLTFAGLTEFILSAGLLAYLQRADPALLRRTAPHARGLETVAGPLATPSAGWLASRKLWAMLGLFLVLTPLGILAS
ncbi:MAG: cobalt transporter CbiM, partial [Acidobacteriaceae bacterium]|nr:cobalt transporter CbiM [Acidobacteriaceae bacterium]